MGYAGSELHHKDLEHEDEGVEISVGVEVTEVIGGRFRDPTDATRTCGCCCFWRCCCCCCSQSVMRSNGGSTCARSPATDPLSVVGHTSIAR